MREGWGCERGEGARRASSREPGAAAARGGASATADAGSRRAGAGAMARPSHAHERQGDRARGRLAAPAEGDGGGRPNHRLGARSGGTRHQGAEAGVSVFRHRKLTLFLTSPSCSSSWPFATLCFFSGREPVLAVRKNGLQQPEVPGKLPALWNVVSNLVASVMQTCNIR